jgi:hypothetical protein
MASTPRKPTKLTAARLKKGKRKGEQEKQVHRGVSTRCPRHDRPATIMDRSSPLANLCVIVPTHGDFSGRSR